MSQDYIILLAVMICITIYNIVKILFKYKNRKENIQSEIDDLYEDIKDEQYRSQPNADVISSLNKQIEFKKTILSEFNKK